MKRPMPTGKTTKSAAASVRFRAADHLRGDEDFAAYIEAMLAEGDAHDLPVALRTIADFLGGMAALADRTGLSRETLYRTLSERGNPRLDTLATILCAFGLRLSVRGRKPTHPTITQRKSLTLVRVGPVTTSASMAAKKP